MAASDPQMPWITRGSKCCPKDQDYLDPYAWYDFFESNNSVKTFRHGKQNVRAKSAAPRTSRLACTEKQAEGWISSASSNSLRNPSPSPATSPPASLKSWRFSPGRTNPKTTQKVPASASPTSLYLGPRRLRCKSAPPARPFGVQPPQRPKTSKSRQGSAIHNAQNAPKRAWQMRTHSAKAHHALLSPEEVQKRHKVRCKSAPLPYDFSAIELVTKIPQNSSDSTRLQAMTRPLACMPDIVKNVLSHNGIKHCCSAYTTRPKTAPDTRQQFWPVSRPSTFNRGSVPKYLHFVQPIRPGSRTPTAQSGMQQSLSETEDDGLYNVERTDLSVCGSDAADLDEAVLYEEQFLIPMTPSEPSVSEQWQSDGEDEDRSQRQDAKVALSQDLMQRYLEDVSNQEPEVHVPTLPEDPEPLEPLKEDEDSMQELMVDVVIKNNHVPERERPDIDVEHDDLSRNGDTEVDSNAGGLQGNSVEQERDDEEVIEDDAENNPITPQEHPDIGEITAKANIYENGFDNEEPLQSVATSLETPSEPPEALTETLEEIPSKEEDETKVPVMNSDLLQFKPQSTGPSQVTFVDSIVLTSYKSPTSKAETNEVVKPILKPSAQAPVVSESPVKQVEPAPKLELPKKKVKPILDRREADLRPQTKENQPWATKVKHGEEESATKDKSQEENKDKDKSEGKKNVPPAKMTEVLAKPKYVPARGAYKMYQAQDLLQHHLEQSRDKRKVSRKSIPAVMPYSPWTPESAAIVNSVLEEEKRKKEGLKPWLQGRLALSKQTSRFELPMDIKVLEAMTPLEYLMKYCIISTRRKALYKHVFQKVDRDRDSKITYKEFDKALKEIHVASIDSQQILKIAELVEVNEKSTFSPDQFAAIAAFSERLLFSDFATPETSRKTHDSKEIIEEADFCGLKSKLNGFKINPPVRKILEIL